MVLNGEVVKEGIRLAGISPVLIPPTEGMVDAGKPEGVIRGLHYELMAFCQKHKKGDLAVIGSRWAERALHACWYVISRGVRKQPNKINWV